jgi:hypothetical protein
MGEILLQCMTFGEIAKSVLKSRFFAISPDVNDFTRFQPDFTHFRFFQTIQHAKHVLTRKIVRFYESKRDFNNLGIKSSTPEEFFAFTLYYYNIGCVCYSLFFFRDLFGDTWPWLDLYQLKIKPVIGLTKPA